MSIYFAFDQVALLTPISNAVQLISSIILLKSQQVPILQASLLGSILSNLLLMTGLGFLLGGINRPKQSFNAPVAQTIGMLLLLAVLSLIISTASKTLLQAKADRVLAQSRGTAVVILVSYFLWLSFQLKTHRSMFDVPPEPLPIVDPKREQGDTRMETMKTLSRARLLKEESENEEEEEEPELSYILAILTLIISTTLIALNTQFATDSI